MYLYTNERGEPNRRTLETDSPNPWGSIEPRLRTTDLNHLATSRKWPVYHEIGCVPRLIAPIHNYKTTHLSFSNC